MKSKESIELIRTIAKDFKLEQKVVEAIVYSQFEAARRKIATTENKEDLINFRFPYLGLLAAKKVTLNKKYRNKQEQK